MALEKYNIAKRNARIDRSLEEIGEDILIQLKILKAHLEKMTDEVIKEEDING